MSLPNSLAAYADCRELFEAALRDPKGARAKLADYDACIRFRTRLHYFRKLDRGANATVYNPDHPMFGTSVYDPYVVQIFPDEDGDGCWIYIQPIGAQVLLIEGLSEGGADIIDVESHEVHMIKDQSK
jgi:hypothetical protein